MRPKDITRMCVRVWVQVRMLVQRNALVQDQLDTVTHDNFHHFVVATVCSYVRAVTRLYMYNVVCRLLFAKCLTVVLSSCPFLSFAHRGLQC
jgi:hypothetical protein